MTGFSRRTLLVTIFALSCAWIGAVGTMADEDPATHLDKIQQRINEAFGLGQPPPEEDFDRWISVPFSGTIHINRRADYEGAIYEGANLEWTDEASLDARISGSEPLISGDGSITGYQAVGRVTARCEASHVMIGEGTVIDTSYSASGTHTHQFEPESGTHWCTLDVNPHRGLYRLGLPTANIDGSAETTMSAEGQTGTTFAQKGCEVGGHSETGYSNVEDRSYDPRSGIIAGSARHEMYTHPRVPMGEGSYAMVQPGDGRYERFAESGMVLAPVNYNITWHLQLDNSPVRVVLEPLEGYDTWMPEPAGGPAGGMGTIPVRVRIVKPQGAEGYLSFQLEDVSVEPGTSLNHPVSGAGDDPDLTINRILNQPALWVSDDGQQAKTHDKVREAVIHVEAHDWGAWGRLGATARLVVGGEEMEVRAVHQTTGEPYVTIPNDLNSNSIADCWEDEQGVSGCGGEADEDDVPEGKSPGDGLSAYEEYRGLHVQGQHLRLDPKMKDLFVWDPDGLVAKSCLASATGLRIHYPLAPEMSCDTAAAGRRRVVNFNTSGQRYHLTDQHGLWVRKGRAPSSAAFEWGYMQGPRIGPPKNADPCVLVFEHRIRETVTDIFNKTKPELFFKLGFTPGAAWLEGHIQQAISYATAHECCHGLNVLHHFASRIKSLPKGADPTKVSPNCGQITCVMRYISGGSDLPDVKVPQDDEVADILCGRLPWPDTLCETDDDCRHQLLVSDVGY